MAHSESSRRAWPTMLMLCALFATSFIDRMVLALVMDPIRLEMNASDTQMSLLFGLGFVLVYVLAGLPAAHMVDHGKRRRILIGGVLLWSLSTYLVGFAPNFTMLAVLRAGVAIGEAVLMPIAMSMIFDLFPKERRTFPVTLFTMTGVVMASGSFIVGAGALALAEQIVGAFGGTPWRVMFMLVAIPGPVIIGLFLLFGHEPARRQEEGGSERPAGTQVFVAHFMSRRSVYLPAFFGTGFIFMIGLGLGAWTSTMMIREHGVPAATAGVYYGICSVIGGVLGTQIAGLLVRRLGRKESVRGIFLTALIMTGATIPVLAFGIGSSDLTLVLFSTGIGAIGVMATTTFVPLLVQQITPRAVLGRTTASYLLVNNIMGMGLGPLLVSAVAAQFASETRSIGPALGIVAWGGFVLAMACFTYALLRVTVWKASEPSGVGAAT